MEIKDELNPSLTSIFNECIEFGFLHGLDFYIHGFNASLSSEFIMLFPNGDHFSVEYSDMGRYRVLQTGTLREVRERFLYEVAWLAGPRGRGPFKDGAPERPAKWVQMVQIHPNAAELWKERDRQNGIITD